MDRVQVADTNGWQEACSAAFVPLRVRTAARVFSADLRRIDLGGGTSLARVVSDASEVYRSDQLIRRTPAEAVLLSLHRSGTGIVRQYGREAKIARGGAAMYDTSVPYTLQFPRRMTELVLQVPRTVFSATGSRFTEMLARPIPESASLQTLTSVANGILAQRVQLGASDRGGMRDALQSLLLAAAGTATPPLPLHRDLLRSAMDEYIRNYASDPDLDPERLAVVHHISLRLVQKCFEETGTSAATAIREQRLQIASERLQHGTPVTTVALSSGFRSADTFSRAYHRRFGAPPSMQLHPVNN